MPRRLGAPGGHRRQSWRGGDRRSGEDEPDASGLLARVCSRATTLRFGLLLALIEDRRSVPVQRERAKRCSFVANQDGHRKGKTITYDLAPVPGGVLGSSIHGKRATTKPMRPGCLEGTVGSECPSAINGAVSACVRDTAAVQREGNARLQSAPPADKHWFDRGRASEGHTAKRESEDAGHGLGFSWSDPGATGSYPYCRGGHPPAYRP